jgi:hypothetical protein
MAIVEFEMYTSSSASGGKVWGAPINPKHGKSIFSAFGTLNRFRTGYVTIKQTNPFDVYSKTSEKRNKGYSFFGKLWIDLDTGAVLKNYSPPKTVEDIVNDNADLIKQEALMDAKPKDLAVVASAFSGW